MVSFVPTESSIVIGLKVILIKFNCSRIVRYGCIKVALLSICETSIVIEVSLARFNIDRRSEALDSLIKVSSSIKWNSFVVVCVCVFWINLNCCWIVFYCQTKLTKFVICEPAVEKCFKVIRVDFKSLRIQRNGRLIVTFLASCVALCVECLCLGFQFRVELNCWLFCLKLWLLGCCILIRLVRR